LEKKKKKENLRNPCFTINYISLSTAAIQDTQRFSPNVLFCSPSRFTKISIAQSFSPFCHEMGDKFVSLVGSGRQVYVIFY
jgi:hypothetical protein